MFRFGSRSRETMVGVHPDLILVAGRALSKSEVDISVMEGLRDIQQQRINVQKGVSKTLDSYHITGDALDLGAYVDNAISWDMRYYFDIAYAMRDAAIELGIRIKWGGGWFVLNDSHDLVASLEAYEQRKKDQKKKPFIDGPHFQRERR